LQAEAAAIAQTGFVKYLICQNEWPAALQAFVPADGSPDKAYSEALFRLFTHKKGDEFLSVFFNGCVMEHFPASMLTTIRKLREMAMPQSPETSEAAPNVFD
jgi:putative ATP-dependent endonuclease of OLD family